MTKMLIVSPQGELSERTQRRIIQIKQACKSLDIEVEHRKIEPKITGAKGNIVSFDEGGLLPPSISGSQITNHMSFFGCKRK